MTSKRQQKSGYLLPAIIDPPTTKSYCVTIPDNNEYRLAFMGALTTLTKWWSWEKTYNGTDTRAKEAAEVWRRVLTIIEDCGGDMPITDLKFRENPTNVCEVQYSTDNGVSWFTMFQKNNCGPASVLNVGDIAITVVDVDTTNNNYVDNGGDITIIYPKWVYNGTGGYTNKVLCYVAKKFVDMICQAMIDEIATHNESRRLDDLLFNHIYGAGSDFALYLATEYDFTPIAAAISAISLQSLVLADAIWDWLVGESDEAFRDEEAKETVACAIYYNIKDGAPTFANWSTALDDYNSWDGNTLTIANVVKEFISDLDIFINYMRLCEDINDLSPLLPVCDCPTTWAHTWNFQYKGLEAWTIGADGYLSPDEGVRGELHTFSAGYMSMQILNLKLNEIIPRCKSIYMTLYCDRGLWGPSLLDSLRLAFPPVPDEAFNSGWFLDGRVSYLWTIADPAQTLDYVEIEFIRSSYTQTAILGDVWVKSIRLSGVGPDPFKGRDTDV